MNLANPPSNAALLDELASGFIDHDFDLKWLHRTIVTSQAYQRSWRPNATNRLDQRNFSRSIVRRLPAELVSDALAQASSGSASLESQANDIETRAIGPCAAIGLGRAGQGRGGDYAARVFGASTRDTNCDCNRSSEPNLLQSIYLQNDQDMLATIERKGSWVSEYSSGKANAEAASPVRMYTQRIEQLEASLAKAEKGKMAGALTVLEEELRETRRELKVARKREAALDSAPSVVQSDPAEIVRQAYLRTLSRPPDPREVEAARAYLTDSDDLGKGVRDLLWALLNTKEFITNH